MHFEKKFQKDAEFQQKAMQMVHLVKDVGKMYDCPWALENPVSVISTLWRQPDFYFHPWEYGAYLSPEEAVHPT